jgi:hypothetical protein
MLKPRPRAGTTGNGGPQTRMKAPAMTAPSHQMHQLTQSGNHVRGRRLLKYKRTYRTQKKLMMNLLQRPVAMTMYK